MTSSLEQLNTSFGKLKKQNDEQVITLVEILSNVTFFGQIKRANCEFAKNGQCYFFILRKESENKIPIARKCRIKECEELAAHCHIELSNITCAMCQKQVTDKNTRVQIFKQTKYQVTESLIRNSSGES